MNEQGFNPTGLGVITFAHPADRKPSANNRNTVYSNINRR